MGSEPPLPKDIVNSITRHDVENASKEIRTAVNKAVSDTLRNWSSTEVDGSRDSAGWTARERMIQRKLLSKKHPGKVTLGKAFYEWLRTSFRNEDAPEKKLAALGSDEDIDPVLMDAMVTYKQNGSRTGVSQWMACATKVNEGEATGLFVFFRDLNPKASKEQQRLTQQSLQFFHEFEVRTKFKEVFDLNKDKIDDALCHFQKKSKDTKMCWRQFCKNNADELGLLMPKTEMLDLANHDGDWLEKKTEVIKCITSSAVGFRIFGFAVQLVLNSVIEKKVNEALEELFKKDKISKSDVEASKKKVLVELSKEPGMSKLADKREILCSYRGVPYKTAVRSLNIQVDLIFESRLREYGAEAGDLEPLLCEHDLAQKTLNAKKGKINKEVFSKCASVRKNINTTLIAKGEVDGPSVREYFKKKEISLSADDPHIICEISFFREMVGAGGQKVLEQRLLQLLPTQQKQVTVKKCLHDMRAVQVSDLFKFTGSGAQGVVLSVCSLVQALEEGTSPKFASNPSAFLMEVRARLANFCRRPVDGKSQELLGALAAAEFAKEALDAEKPTMPMLEMPTKFSWLLDPAVARRISELRAKLMKEAASLESLDSEVTTPAKRKGNPASGSSSCPGSSSKVARTSEVEAALAMFRKKS